MIVWLIFVVLCAGVLFFRPAVAVFCLILLSHFDLGSRGGSSIVFGLANSVKSLVIPLILLLRLRGFHALGVTTLKRWWVAFSVYATLACLWSPFLISAAKMAVYLFCYLIFFHVVRLAWERKWLTPKAIVKLVFVSIAIGMLQTYMMGNSFGTLDEAQFNERFSSFSSPQSFAAFMACCVAIILFSDLSWVKYKIPTSVVALYFLVQTGSRYCVVGCFLIIVFRVGVYFYQRSGILKAAAYSLASIGTLLVALSSLAAYFPNNRITELVDAQLVGASAAEQLETVGSFYWRVQIYDATVERMMGRIQRAEVGRLFLGSGTSSGGEILSEVHTQVFNMFDDNNRAIHNEFLRTAYEWGVVGLVLFCVFLWLLVRYVYSQATMAANFVPLSVVPLFMIGLLIENLLAASSSPAGMGYVMAFSFVQSDSYSNCIQALATGAPNVPQL